MNFCESRTHSCKKVLGWVCFGFLIAFIFAMIFGFFVKLIWGVTLTPMFGLVEPSYFQAVGIIILGRLIFGGFGKKHPTQRSPKEKFYGKLHERFHNRCSTFSCDEPEETVDEPSEECAVFSRFWKD